MFECRRESRSLSLLTRDLRAIGYGDRLRDGVPPAAVRPTLGRPSFRWRRIPQAIRAG